MTTPEYEDDPRLDRVLRAALSRARTAADVGPAQGGFAVAGGFAAAANTDEADDTDGLLDDLTAQHRLDDVDDALLLRWRAGQLDAEQTAAMDARLAADAETRARAIALLDGPSEAAFAEAERMALAGRRTRTLRWLALAAAALLVGLGGWWMGQRAPAPLAPDYSSSGLLGGMAAVRGPKNDANPSPRFLADGTLTVNLRPATAQAAPGVEVFVAVQPAEGPAGALHGTTAAQVETFEDGAIRVRAVVGALVGNRPGRYALHLALGTSTGGKAEGRVAEDARRDAPGTRWFEHHFELLPEGATPDRTDPPNLEVPP